MTTASAALPRTGGSPGGGAPRRTPAPAPGPDERIAHVVAEALGSARTVLDSDSLPGLGGARLPFGDQSFDAATMLCNAPRVSDALTRLRELRRVTRGPVVVLAVDPSRVRGFWLDRYAPAVLAVQARRHPPVAHLVAALGGSASVRRVPIPLDCTDTFDEAYYGRPELLLDPAARRPGSAWSFVDDRAREAFDTTLRRELRSGEWDERFGHLRRLPAYEGSLVIVRAAP
ncbi:MULTISPECIES: SAM-dependent methyltransferase [Streptomyces]|uniref:SAM-dependent methyltransferase n=1 Tax=Streptomyces TaxID=1883 RepID=UPI0020303A63|nr:SAM-dependent methyltransferase [Streptomyces sp. G2]MCM1948066.1 SAM-dependent methyltransferase [Streptomyces sp. G2]